MSQVPLDERLFRLDGDQPVLLGSTCAACGESFFPRRRLCAICASPTRPVDLSPAGELYSYTYVHAPYFGRRRIDSGGYGVAQVDLPEGVRVQTVLTGDPATWRIGMPVRISAEVVDERDGDEIVIFRFSPLEAARA